MFNSLASLAERHGKRTVILAAIFFVIAGGVGGSVAKHLDPYGADDPSTQSVIADHRLEAAGFRDVSVIVLIENASPTRGRRPAADRGDRAAGAARSERAERGRLRRDQESRLRLEGRPHDLSRGHPEAHRRQGAAGRREADQGRARGAARRHGRRLRPRDRAGEHAGGTRPANGGDARLPAALPAHLLVLPQRGCRVAAADDRRAGNRRDLPDPANRQRVRLDLDLRAEPDHGARPGPGDRLQPLRGVPVPRGDRAARARAWRR